MDLILPLLVEYPFLISFFGPLIGGEPVFIALAFLSGTEVIPLWVLFISGTLANIIGDTFWFYVPRKFKSIKYIHNLTKNYNSKLRNIEKKELPYVIITSDFLVGARLLTVMSISLNGISYRRFIKYSIIGSFIWSTVIISLGWFAGKGFVFLSQTFEGFRIVLTTIFIIVIIYLLFRHKRNRLISLIVHRSIIKGKNELKGLKSRWEKR